MATVSGMKYDEVKNLIDFLQGKAESIDTILDGLSTEIPGKIAQVYSGDAADKYQAVLKNCSITIQTTLNELVSSLATQAGIKEEEYKTQEKKLADSADV